MFASPTPVDGLAEISPPQPSPLSATSMRTACPSRVAVIQMSAPFAAGVTAYLIAFSISGGRSSDGSRAPIVSDSIW
ncbi:MAG: hypothetical protein HOP95_10705, partial [Sphingomonas sp.]|nr:hypothetical protein [Sphingomonas sp.]